MSRFVSFLVLGLGGAIFLYMAWRGWRSGELRAGSRGLFEAYRPNREDNPFGFHFYLLLYTIVGAWFCVYALLILVGSRSPIPWH